MPVDEQLITDHLDTWSSTVKPKSSAGRGKSDGKQELYGIKKLRELILELAVRGLLVPQDPNDEPASELLKRISAEKYRLLNEGKIKKQKATSPIAKENIPWNVPNNWKWIRIGDILDRISNGFSGKQDKSGNGKALTRIETISESKINFSKVGYSQSIPQEKLEYYKLTIGDILLSHINSDYHVGKTALVADYQELYHGVNLLLLRPSKLALSNYIDLSINQLRLSGFFLSIAQHAIGQSSINQKKVVETLIPLPPLAEQHRIVAKVDELMALCDQLEGQQANHIEAHQTLVQTLLSTLTQSSDAQQFATAWTRIQANFDTLFTTESSIDQLKQTILQLAVMGKLVPQDPNDEPASELLKKIASEKAGLAKSGKIKKQKPLSPISDDDCYFVTPSKWSWARLDSLLVFGPTNGYSPKAVNYQTSVRSLTLSATTSGVFKGDEHSKFIDEEIPNDSDLWLQNGDILVQRGNTIEYVGVPAVYHGEPNKFIYPDLMMKLQLASDIFVDYAHLVMSNHEAREYLQNT